MFSFDFDRPLDGTVDCFPIFFRFDIMRERRETNYQSTAPENGNILRVIQRHIGEGHVITLTDGADLETSFEVGFVPAWES